MADMDVQQKTTEDTWGATGVLTRAELAKMLRCSERTIDRYERDPDCVLKGRRMGQRVLFCKKNVDRYLSSLPE